MVEKAGFSQQVLHWDCGAADGTYSAIAELRLAFSLFGYVHAVLLPSKELRSSRWCLLLSFLCWGSEHCGKDGPNLGD